METDNKKLLTSGNNTTTDTNSAEKIKDAKIGDNPTPYYSNPGFFYQKTRKTCYNVVIGIERMLERGLVNVFKRLKVLFAPMVMVTMLLTGCVQGTTNVPDRQAAQDAVIEESKEPRDSCL